MLDSQISSATTIESWKRELGSAYDTTLLAGIETHAFTICRKREQENDPERHRPSERQHDAERHGVRRRGAKLQI